MEEEEESTIMSMGEGEDIPMVDMHAIPPEGHAPCVTCDAEEE